MDARVKVISRITDAAVSPPVQQTSNTAVRPGPLRVGVVVQGASAPKPKLLDQVRNAIPTRHYSYRTEEA